IFRWIPYKLQSLDDFRKFNATVLNERERGLSVPFATVERSSGQIVGTTRYMNMDLANRKVEVGSTWIAPPWQRTAINTEAKYLMLRHAFETWKCLRVELKTNARALRSFGSGRKKKAPSVSTCLPGTAGSATRFTSASLTPNGPKLRPGWNKG